MAKIKKNKGPSQRQLRVGEMLRHELASIFTQQVIHDETLQSEIITVSEVTVSPDLRAAVAYILPLGGDNADAVVKAARSHIPLIRSMLGGSLSLKYVPTLNFNKDSAFENKAAMDTLLSHPHIARDLGETQNDAIDALNKEAEASDKETNDNNENES